MIEKIFCLCAIVALSLAEAPINAPYPPSGWKPKGAPFTLPKEFLPQQTSELEVTKERVEFAGQLAETTTQFPSNSYLPPEDEDSEDAGQGTEDLLKVQGLPSNEPSQFNNQNFPPNNNQNFPPNNNVQAQNNVPQSGRLRQLQQRNRQQQQFAQNQQQFGQQQQFGRIQQQQFNSQKQFNYQQQQQQQFGQINEQPQQQQAGFAGQQPGFAGQQPGFAGQQPGFAGQQPVFPGQQDSTQFRKGGRPQFGDSFTPQFGARQPPTQEYGPPQAAGDNDVESNPEDGDEALGNGGQPFGSAGQLNLANNDAEDDNQQQQFGQQVGTVMALSNGRYYVLTPDNTLQRVVFMTSQDAEEARTKGFTAQLRYMPVEPIRDPIYAYNEQGQLVRIFKK